MSLNNSSVCERRYDVRDFSVELLEELLDAVRAIAELVEHHGVAGVCCEGGCGRTGLPQYSTWPSTREWGWGCCQDVP